MEFLFIPTSPLLNFCSNARTSRDIRAMQLSSAKQYGSAGWVRNIFRLVFTAKVGYTYFQIMRGNAPLPTSFSGISVDSKIASMPPADAALQKALATYDDPDMGNAANPILTIVEFADFGCPYSKEANYIPQFLSSFTDRVRFVYRDFPVLELHPTAALAGEAGECAQEQKRFFDYADKVFRNQNDISDAALRRYAREIGLNPVTFDECLDSHPTGGGGTRRTDLAAGVRGLQLSSSTARGEGAVPLKIFERIIAKY